MVEAEGAFFRLVRAVHAIAVNLAGVCVWQVTVKCHVGVLGQFDTFQLDFTGGVEQAQFDFGGVG